MYIYIFSLLLTTFWEFRDENCIMKKVDLNLNKETTGKDGNCCSFENVLPLTSQINGHKVVSCGWAEAVMRLGRGSDAVGKGQ